MSLSYNAILIMVLGLTILVVGIILFTSKRKIENKKQTTTTDANKLNNNSAKGTSENAYKKNPNADVAKEDIFNFMEFDKIQDNMIIQNNGEK